MGSVHRCYVHRHVATERRALQVVFGYVDDSILLARDRRLHNASAGFKQFTGYEGIFCGFSAIYAGLAQVLNEIFGKTVLPLGAVKR